MNSPSLDDPTGQVASFVDEFARTAKAQGFREEPYGQSDTAPLLAFTRRSPEPHPRIYISAGIHGDEPAPPLALLSLLDQGFFDQRANWFLCPVINPAGLQKGTRENLDGIDLNRDFLHPTTSEIRAHTTWLNRQPCFDVALCLHEDWESQGIYIYEVNRRSSSGHARAILESAQAALPVETATVIDDRPIDEPGIIRPVSDPLLRESWPETIYLINHHTSLGYTFETPSGLPLAQRIRAQELAVAATVTTAIRDHGQTSPDQPSTAL